MIEAKEQNHEVRQFSFTIAPGLEEDKIWRQQVRPLLSGIPANVLEICHYGFTEMVNNVIDHSAGRTLVIRIGSTTNAIRMDIIDDGVGIFQKLQTELGLEDHRHAILELAKGKTTTAPQQHTGEGIFFTSRMFDNFSIISGRLRFTHDALLGEDRLVEIEKEEKGTTIILEIHPQSQRTMKGVFDQFAAGEEDYGFTRTQVPVTLAQYGDENLVSRSQAKRLLARFDRFKEVQLDFKGVLMIGPAFADEIFRVFRHQNPQIRLIWLNATAEVEKMIRRALSNGESAEQG
jgi:anti-sigma regulatory factor (Ser/Thr protein kinase)